MGMVKLECLLFSINFFNGPLLNQILCSHKLDILIIIRRKDIRVGWETQPGKGTICSITVARFLQTHSPFSSHLYQLPYHTGHVQKQTSLILNFYLNQAITNCIRLLTTNWLINLYILYLPTPQKK